MAPRERANRLRVGRLPVDVVTRGGALDAIEDMIARGDGGTVFTPNVDHVVLADDDPRFRVAYERVSLSLADGMPIVWVSRVLGQALPERVAGSDLVEPLLRRAEAKGWRIFLFGGAPGVAEIARERLLERMPRLLIVGADASRVDMNEPASARAGIVRAIRAAKPDLVLVALGAPKQELWIDEASLEVGPAVLLGLGASLDFIAGTARRAPSWVSAAGLEWLYRLAREPKRLWRRYLIRDPKFLLIVARAIVGGRNERVVGHDE
jgi:N-acetylglucosaminyldiphosphoundecaprenol N-acetyl-beta-D-mannosaminyltransferase